MRRLSEWALLIFALSFVSLAEAQKNEVDATPTPTPTPMPTATPAAARDAVAEQVQQVIAEVSGMSDFADRERAVSNLYADLNNAMERNPSVSAISYAVDLEPVFERKAKLNTAAACLEARSEIIYKTSGGTGFSGTFPASAVDALKLLAAVCQQPKLSELPTDK